MSEILGRKNKHEVLLESRWEQQPSFVEWGLSSYPSHCGSVGVCGQQVRRRSSRRCIRKPLCHYQIMASKPTYRLAFWRKCGMLMAPGHDLCGANYYNLILGWLEADIKRWGGEIVRESIKKAFGRLKRHPIWISAVAENSDGGLLRWGGFPHDIESQLSSSLEILHHAGGFDLREKASRWVEKWEARWMEVYRAEAGFEPSFLDPL
ncbi:hypothetical protein M407DRAFT_11440 [Tulasnella calospora MUT 4182]|uniref:Uncharacterized protein n=1 Tax=Tulasnella calospora MUT 4182 TaxID=1051891 RepID=A0A0C3LD42_9AGAM|nr:hypothetical protein M407DRAFT_11440 [Tulasnella calospora MUT 4182]